MTAIRVFENRPKNNIRNKKNITLLLAHGAGASADSAFMECLAEALASEGIAVVRFEFPYMERVREGGRKRPPDRQPLLLARFREVLRQVTQQSGGPVFIGGKSMGGRMASLLAAESDLAGVLAGCVCFGYPFHPPGRPDRWRLEHFGQFCCPIMIVQGTRDPFGKQDEVENELANNLKSREAFKGPDLRIQWLSGGNHDFKPLAKQPETPDMMIAKAAKAASVFMSELC